MFSNNNIILLHILHAHAYTRTHAHTHTHTHTHTTHIIHFVKRDIQQNQLPIVDERLEITALDDYPHSQNHSQTFTNLSRPFTDTSRQYNIKDPSGVYVEGILLDKIIFPHHVSAIHAYLSTSLNEGINPPTTPF